MKHTKLVQELTAVEVKAKEIEGLGYFGEQVVKERTKLEITCALDDRAALGRICELQAL